MKYIFLTLFQVRLLNLLIILKNIIIIVILNIALFSEFLIF